MDRWGGSVSRRRLVTIIADASLCHDTKAAGWAAWMKTEGMPSYLTGSPFKTEPREAIDAETLALANALHIAVKRGFVSEGSEVLLQSDCLWALSVVLYSVPGARDRQHAGGLAVLPAKNAGHWRPPVTAATKLIADTVGGLGLSLFVRHVKGHSSGDGRRWVNGQCDAEAKKHMRAERAIRSGANP